jgi:hypothetical protein
MDCVFAVSAITSICCACLTALLKSAYRSECVDGYLGPSGSVVRPAAISCIVAAALSMTANAAVVCRSHSKGAWAIAAEIGSKWQPWYFIVVSAQRVILRIIVTVNIKVCPSKAEYEQELEAALFIWDITILLSGVSTIATDSGEEYAPRRRCVHYLLLVLCLLVDAISSYIWGNAMSKEITEVNVGFLHSITDNQITSSITSQIIIALHFLFVSWRSRNGRGWAFASLRFELHDCGGSSLSKLELSATDMKHITNVSSVTASAASAKAPTFESEGDTNFSQNEAVAASSPVLRLRHRFLRFQQRHLSRCRVFIIPFLAHHDVGMGESFLGADAEFTIARPAFDISFMRPLQRIADATPKSYISFMIIVLVIPSFACSVFLSDQARGISTLLLNSCYLIMLLGLLSSRRYCLDRIAVKHVALSFRFAACVALCAWWCALNIRESIEKSTHPTRPAAGAILIVIFLFCLLLDCSPQVPSSLQISLTVTALCSLT